MTPLERQKLSWDETGENIAKSHVEWSGEGPAPEIVKKFETAFEQSLAQTLGAGVRVASALMIIQLGKAESRQAQVQEGIRLLSVEIERLDMFLNRAATIPLEDSW